MSQFSPGTRERLEAFEGSEADSEAVQNQILEDLRRIVLGNSIFDSSRFSETHLSEETKELLKQKPRGLNEYRLNRMLIRDAYPSELAGIRASVRVIHRDAHQILWFGGARQLSRYDGTGVQYLPVSAESSNDRIWKICTTDDGAVWCGTDSGGVAGYDGTALTAIDFRDGLSGNSIFAVEPDSDGNIWIGAANSGLTRYRRGKARPGIRITSIGIDENKWTDPGSVPQISSGRRITINSAEIDFKTHPEKRQFRFRISNASGDIVSIDTIK